MAVCKDLTGKVFGYLTVVSRAENTKDGRARWNCVCKCGNLTVVPTYRLNSGGCKSCGCKRFESKNAIHRMTKTDIYNKWLSMKQRCFDKNCKSYRKYGAIGITVCDEWANDFLAFMNWSLKNGYKPGMSLDRIDNKKGYFPENCRWVVWKEQCNNRRSNIKITYQGKTQTLKQWCDELGLNYYRTRQRIKKSGMTFEEAISKPLMESRSHRKNT